MVFTVVPTDDLVVFLDEREEVVCSAVEAATLLHLCQEPRTGDDCMGLEELNGGSRRHLAGDDTRQIALYRQFVDGNNLVGLDDDAQRTLKLLCLLALPMEVDADGDIAE